MILPKKVERAPYSPEKDKRSMEQDGTPAAGAGGEFHSRPATAAGVRSQLDSNFAISGKVYQCGWRYR